MFEKAPTYEAGYVGRFPCQDDLLPEALAWAATRAKAHDCRHHRGRPLQVQLPRRQPGPGSPEESARTPGRPSGGPSPS